MIYSYCFLNQFVCTIQSIDNIYNNDHIQIILFSNNLSTIHSELIGRWDELEDIDIRYNPWICECSNQWMIDTIISVMKEKKLSIIDDIK